MRQKTVRLGDDYRIKNGKLMTGCVVDDGINDETGHPINTRWDDRESRFQIGGTAVLASVRYIGPPRHGVDGNPRWKLWDGPVPGNSDPSIKRYHGWRGTNNDYYREAHGERKILSMRTGKDGHVRVTLGKDIKPDEA